MNQKALKLVIFKEAEVSEKKLGRVGQIKGKN